MATNTAVGRTVFILGKEFQGNRQAYVVEDTAEYSVDASTNTVYTSVPLARFPYTIV